MLRFQLLARQLQNMGCEANSDCVNIKPSIQSEAQQLAYVHGNAISGRYGPLCAPEHSHFEDTPYSHVIRPSG